MEKTAIVTGASSGIGEAVSRMFCEKGYRVYGFGRDFSKCVLLGEASFQGVFCPIEGDLLDTHFVTEVIRKIRKEQEIDVLVNNAGVGYYGLHEELNTKKIQEMVRMNLELPLILTQLLLRDLKKRKGMVVNISSVTAEKSNPHGCAYGATKAGLSGFSRSLFDETRKYGVKVVNIQPDMTKTNLYRNADFSTDEEEESYLLPEEVADAVRYALELREGVVPAEITLCPQFHRIRKKQSGKEGEA